MTNNNIKTLYFEGAGCVARGNVPNCRIRTAFHLDDGRPVYLEISGMNTTSSTAPMYRRFTNYGIIDHLHFAGACKCGDDRSVFGFDRTYAFEYTLENILALVNSMGASFDAVEVLPALSGYRVHADNGGYNYADRFVLDRDLLEARQNIDEQIRKKEIARCEKSICYSLWVDSEDPAVLHYKNFRTGENFEICVAVPESIDRLPVLNKSNAVVGAVYACCGSHMYLQRVYRISEEYAERYQLMYLDRCEVSTWGDIALPGSDIYHCKALSR